MNLIVKTKRMTDKEARAYGRRAMLLINDPSRGIPAGTIGTICGFSRRYRTPKVKLNDDQMIIVGWDHLRVY